MNETFDKVTEMLQEYVDCPVSDIDTDTALVKDLHMTSFDMITMLSELEDEYEVTVSTDKVSELSTVGDLCHYIEALRA